MSAHTHIEPVLILGGGLAGLSTAFHLRRPWLLVEKESRVGGLVRTERVNGFTIDSGADSMRRCTSACSLTGW